MGTAARKIVRRVRRPAMWIMEAWLETNSVGGSRNVVRLV